MPKKKSRWPRCQWKSPSAGVCSKCIRLFRFKGRHGADILCLRRRADGRTGKQERLIAGSMVGNHGDVWGILVVGQAGRRNVVKSPSAGQVSLNSLPKAQETRTVSTLSLARIPTAVPFHVSTDRKCYFDTNSFRLPFLTLQLPSPGPRRRYSQHQWPSALSAVVGVGHR